jgi:hypothetical protein
MFPNSDRNLAAAEKLWWSPCIHKMREQKIPAFALAPSAQEVAARKPSSRFLRRAINHPLEPGLRADSGMAH